MWQLKLSSGGGTYGIHFCFVFDDDWSFKPKNILVVVVVVFLVVREKTTCSSYKKKLTRQSILPPQLQLAFDDLLEEWAPLTSRLFFGVDLPLTLDLKSEESSEAKLRRRLSFISWRRNDTNQL